MLCIIKKPQDNWPWLEYALDLSTMYSEYCAGKKTFIIFALRPSDRWQLSKAHNVDTIVYFPHTTPLKSRRTRNIFGVVKRIFLEPSVVISAILTSRIKLKCENLIVFDRDDIDYSMLEREFNQKITYNTLQVVKCPNPDKNQFENSKNKLILNHFLWIDQPLIKDAVVDYNTLGRIINSKIDDLEQYEGIKHFIVTHPRSDGAMRKVLEDRLHVYDYKGDFTPGTVFTLFSQLAACWIGISNIELLGTFPEQIVLRKMLCENKK